jgi:hypothetical protein
MTSESQGDGGLATARAQVVGILQDTLANLGSESVQAKAPLFFPGGINLIHIKIKVTAFEVELRVGGPDKQGETTSQDEE